MKNLTLAVLIAAALVACKKTETTMMDSSADDAVVMPADTAGMVGDAATATVSSNQMSDQDKKFAEEAATGGMMEVMMGKLAATNATHAKVKAFGKMMATDHGKANDELKSWATTAGYSLPESLTADQQKKYDELKNKKGVDFDRAYTDLMVIDHKKDIADFKKAATDVTEVSLKSFASKTLPTLEHHLTSSEEAKKMVK